jgi:alpha-1,3-rhamnosyltransferase
MKTINNCGSIKAQHNAAPLVTIVVPVYNHEKYVRHCLVSILEQTYQNIELIVINDGSSDQSDSEIKSLVPALERRLVRFTYITRENVGLSETLNHALAWAHGDFFSVLASDDIATQGKIEILVDHLQSAREDCVAVFGDAEFIDDSGRTIFLDRNGCGCLTPDQTTYSTFLKFYTRGRGDSLMKEEFGTYKSIIEGNYLPAMSCVLKTGAVRRVSGWTKGNPLEDFEMWLKLSKTYTFRYVNESVAFYRRHDSNTIKISSTEILLATLKIYRKEKSYCVDHRLKRNWNIGYYPVFGTVLTDTSLTYAKKLSLLTMEADDIFILARAVARKMLSKLKTIFFVIKGARDGKLD